MAVRWGLLFLGASGPVPLLRADVSAFSSGPEAVNCIGSQCPEQRHLSFGQTDETMVAMWVTPAAVERPACHFGRSQALGTLVPASSTLIWQVGGIQEFSHSCELAPLSPGGRYFYAVGDEASQVWSATATFRAKPNETTWAPTILVYGDLGFDTDVSLPSLVREASSGSNDFVLHVGDFAYDLNSDGGEVGRRFMREIDPIASTLPYMTCIGNHEGGTELDHASSMYHYMNRFQMPGSGDLVHGPKGNNIYYSFDAGPAHIVVFSTEVYFWQLWDAAAQFEFLKHDLEAVDRRKTPWVITMAHRPMYCSNSDGDDCTRTDSNVRLGLPGPLGSRKFKLEELIREHKVDVALWAHEHSYERSWPVFDNQVMNGTTAPYVDPGATVHIVSGASGCSEHFDGFDSKKPRGSWSAMRSATYGYGKLSVLNASHLHWRQFDAVSGSVVDEIMLVKTRELPTGYVSKGPFTRRLALVNSTEEHERHASIYASTAGCTARGVFPQHHCGAETSLSEHLV